MWVHDLSSVIALAEALKQNSTLTTLGLRLNNLGPEGARHIAAALGSNSSLEQLDVRDNRIDDAARELLRDAAKGKRVELLL